MKDEKILGNEELEQVNGGGIFGGEKMQLFFEGEEVRCLCVNTTGGVVVSEFYINVIIVKCLGKKKGIFYDTYEYIIREVISGREYQVSQSKLSRKNS